MPMRKWRAVLALVATTVAFAFSFVMLRQAIGPDSPWLGLVLMFCFLGLAKIAEPLFVLRMPRWLRPLRPWERFIGRAMVNGQYFAVTFFVLV